MTQEEVTNLINTIATANPDLVEPLKQLDDYITETHGHINTLVEENTKLTSEDAKQKQANLDAFLKRGSDKLSMQTEKPIDTIDKFMEELING